MHFPKQNSKIPKDSFHKTSTSVIVARIHFCTRLEVWLNASQIAQLHSSLCGRVLTLHLRWTLTLSFASTCTDSHAAAPCGMQKPKGEMPLGVQGVLDSACLNRTCQWDYSLHGIHTTYMCENEKHEWFPWKLTEGTTEMHVGAAQPRQRRQNTTNSPLPGAFDLALPSFLPPDLSFFDRSISHATPAVWQGVVSQYFPMLVCQEVKETAGNGLRRSK